MSRLFCLVTPYARITFNPNRPGRFLKFSKNLPKKFQSSISPQLRVPEERTIARLKGLILGFHFGQVSPCRRAPLPRNFGFFFRYRILLGFVARGLVVEGYGVAFFLLVKDF